jgi:hypothetical protein
MEILGKQEPRRSRPGKPRKRSASKVLIAGSHSDRFFVAAGNDRVRVSCFTIAKLFEAAYHRGTESSHATLNMSRDEAQRLALQILLALHGVKPVRGSDGSYSLPLDFEFASDLLTSLQAIASQQIKADEFDVPPDFVRQWTLVPPEESKKVSVG